MVIQLPEKVKYIINSLQAAGYEAYAVGGCVRDCVLGREPEDWDITTSAKRDDLTSSTCITLISFSCLSHFKLSNVVTL